MDYGTIISRLETGDYADCVTTFIDKNKSPSSSVNEKYKTTSPMEQIICRVIHDVDQVFENCRIFNPNGNSFFRAGEIHVRKWKAYFNRFVLGRLSEKVKFDLETIASCSNAPCSSLEQKELHKYSNTSETSEKANAHDVLPSTSDCDQGDCNHPEQAKDKTKRRRCRSKSSCENSLSTSILKTGAWTSEEHTKFLEGYDKHVSDHTTYGQNKLVFLALVNLLYLLSCAFFYSSAIDGRKSRRSMCPREAPSRLDHTHFIISPSWVNGGLRRKRTK